jgi:transglutaminase/protease-like cytokinesis protein 3
MPTSNGATDVLGATRLLTERMQAEQSLPTEEQEPEQETPAKPEAIQDEPETPPGDTDAEIEKYKVKVDGEELEVTLDELQKGYMMEANYRNKTTALNQKRESIEEKALEVDRQLDDARALIEDEISNLESPEMKELKEFDPDAYIKAQDKVRAKVQKFEKLKAKRADEHRARQDKLVKKEREALFDMFPEWSDSAVMSKESSELMQVIKSFGYTDTEVQNLTDHRIFMLADKARKFDAIQSIDIESKIVQPKPKSVKPGNGTNKEDIASVEKKGLRQKLKSTGSIHDAMKLF